MKSTKTCRKCGWVLDASSDLTSCPICGSWFPRPPAPLAQVTPSPPKPCRICGSMDLYRGTGLCRSCLSAQIKTYNARAYAKWVATQRQRYADWRAKIAMVPKNYPTLTEAQWLEAVKHFGGCACCGKEQVEARGYFIVFKDGGRYCDWNMIPMCDRCATYPKDQPNLWIQARYSLAPIDAKHLQGIIEYLEPKLNAAIGERHE